ncbi:cyclophilin-like fold protein [uncultured Akkermansia sp.]|uniref:cyclophilin-like fold protein n=1 Tax=Akkermansia sp. TaxID=1872421 RepID=UPI0025D8A75F|nr:cyclophilin-like fold protein [uncultured Akkermansia sp.]
MNNVIKITVGSSTFTATLSDNAAAAAFQALLPLTLKMEDVNGNEKFYRLSRPLPVAAVNPGIVHEGDLMLWGAEGLVLFYKTFSTSYNYTRLGRIDNAAGLAGALGSGDVEVTFELKQN